MQKNLEYGPKKSAIVCYGVRISMDATNVRSVDLRYMRGYLMNMLGRSQVDYVCKKLAKDENLDYYKNITETDLNDYDEVFIYNSTYNLFGGVFFKHSIDTFLALKDCKADMYWVLLDPKMPPLDYGAFVKSRIKDGVVKVDSGVGDFAITPEYCDEWSRDVFPRIKVAYAGETYDRYYDTYTNGLSAKKAANKAAQLIPNNEWTNFWLFEYYAINEALKEKLTDYDFDGKTYDLVYFGNNRNTERNKLIANLYNNSCKKLCVGFDPSLENCDIRDYVKHDELFPTIGRECLATVVIGDKLHDNNVRTPRFFEAMLLDTVAFIYTGFDPEKKYVTDPVLRDFIYVSSAAEIEEKLSKIRNNEAFYRDIVRRERQDILNQFKDFDFEN